MPAGVTLFCLASESNSACGVMPSVASLACENSTIDALVLGAVEVDLGDAGHLQQPLAHAFGGLLQLRVVGAVAGHHVEDGIDVGEFVVDDRAENARRQLALHVGQLLAQQVEQIRHVLRRGRILEGDLHRRERRLGIGLHLLEDTAVPAASSRWDRRPGSAFPRRSRPARSPRRSPPSP